MSEVLMQRALAWFRDRQDESRDPRPHVDQWLRGFVLAILGLNAVLWAAPQHGPPSWNQQSAFRSRTDLVQVDVVVLGPDGRPVRGLTKEDFVLLDAGQERTIQFFAETTHDVGQAVVAAPDVGDNGVQTDRVVIIAVDDLHQYNRTEEVKQAAARVIAELGDFAVIGLVTSSGRVGIEPTANRDRLLKALDDIDDALAAGGRPTRSGSVGSTVLPSALPVTADDRGGYAASAFGGGTRRVGMSQVASPVFDLGLYFGNITACRVLGDVAQMLRNEAFRRRAFVWISRGGDCGGADGTDLEIQRLLNELRLANVAVYSVDPGGPGWNPGLLSTISSDSGGFVVKPDDDSRGLDRVVDALNHYYLLAFAPPADLKPGYRPLEVRSRRPGLTLRSRRGYMAGLPRQTSRARNRLVQLSTGVLPIGDLPLRATATVVPIVRSGRLPVWITFEVGAPRQLLLRQGAGLTDTLQYAVLAVDLDRRSVSDTAGHQLSFEVPEGDLPSDGLIRIQVATRMDLRPGRYQLRLSATSERLASGGSVYLQFEVPDPRKAQLGIGGMVLEAMERSAALVLRKPLPAHLPFAPSLDREYSASDRLRVYAPFWYTEQASLEVVAEVMDAGRTLHVVRRQVDPVALRAIDVELPLRGILPGRYRLRLTASDGVNRATAETLLTIAERPPSADAWTCCQAPSPERP